MYGIIFGIDIGKILVSIFTKALAVIKIMCWKKNQSFYNKNPNINANFDIISRTVSEKNKNNRFSIIMTRSSDDKFLSNFVLKINYYFVNLDLISSTSVVCIVCSSSNP